MFIRNLVLPISLLVSTVVANDQAGGGLYNRPPVHMEVEVGYAPQTMIAMEQYAEHQLRNQFPPQDRANPNDGVSKTHGHLDGESESSSDQEDSSSEGSGSLGNQTRIYSGLFITICLTTLNAIHLT